MNYAQIALDVAVPGVFHYHIPPELEGQLAPGHLVRVAFRTAMQPGIVVALDASSPVEITKPVLERLDAAPMLTPAQIALAQWLAAHTLTPLGQCLWRMLPPGIVGRADVLITLLQADASVSDPLHSAIIARLNKRSPLRGEQLRQSLREERLDKALRALQQAGIIQVESILGAPRARPKKIQAAALALHPDQIDDALPGLPAKTHALSAHILRVLAREPRPLDVSWVYAQTGAKLPDLKRLEERGLIWLGEQQQWRDSLAKQAFVPLAAPVLTQSQAEVWAVVREALERPTATTPTFLLHGVTGSGKTEIYLRAIEHTLAQKRQAILLVPEIALTAQTIRRVTARFPGRIAVLHEAEAAPAAPEPGKIALVHSGLSIGERYDTWQRARAGEVDVIVGTRSALFAPLPDVGLIILDEEHDDSYKQSPPGTPPYYHARAVAEERMRQNRGVVILGSATPDIATYRRAQQGEIGYLRLPNRIMGHRATIAQQSASVGVLPLYRPSEDAPLPNAEALTIDLPPVKVVDMREELKAGNTGIFSRALLAALDETLARGEQAILFMNRRGSASYVFCRDCGYVATCHNCDMPLTYHAHDALLRCHYCGHQQANPTTCPQCSSQRIRYFGAGTQQIEAAFQQMFPNAVTLRWDADTIARPGDHDLILERFSQKRADVLIGTQMIAKGLDVPLVTLVGVVSADIGLGLPDYRAGERTFQILAQVAGRAGRGVLGGRVILQTYQPAHYAVQAAAGHDYERFYEREIAYRRDLGYPPFRRLARLLFRHEDEARARHAAQRTAELLRRQLNQTELDDTVLIGPAPCFFNRVNHTYRWHLVLRGSDPARVLRGLALQDCTLDLDPMDVL